MIGIGIDGQQVMYLRYASSENRARYFQPSRSKRSLNSSATEDSSAAVFKSLARCQLTKPALTGCYNSLRFFQRRALEPHALAEVFGPEAEVASSAIGALYHNLLTTDNDRVDMFFKQWDMIFGVVYGQELETRRRRRQELAKLYNIATNPTSNAYCSPSTPTTCC